MDMIAGHARTDHVSTSPAAPLSGRLDDIPHPKSRPCAPHDPMTCGLYRESSCATCQAAWDDDVVVPRDLSVRAQLDAILQEYDAADQRLRRAAVMGDHDGAEQADRERLESLASKIESHRAIADLLLLLVRVAIGTDRGAALGLYLGEVLAPVLRPIAEAVATLETHVAALERRCRL